MTEESKLDIEKKIKFLEVKIADTLQEEKLKKDEVNLLLLQRMQTSIEMIKWCNNHLNTTKETPKEKLCKNCIHIKQGQPFRHRGRGKYMQFYKCEIHRRLITMQHGGTAAKFCKEYEETKQ